jgi:NitT/TauT family transport system permease protein
VQKQLLLSFFTQFFGPCLQILQTGIAAIPRNWKMIAENYAIRSTPYLLSIAIPAASPHLIAGLKIAWSRAWRALITAEMLFGAVSGAGGLGWYIQSKRVFMDTAGLFAGIIAIMISGSLVEYFLFSALEKETIKKWGMHT